ncbi:hypothetical protein NCPPB3923_05575 [Burkholderia glumae]|nr:hypothetical protein NCPPB3923_05575 [Burkholderia glumae]
MLNGKLLSRQVGIGKFPDQAKHLRNSQRMDAVLRFFQAHQSFGIWIASQHRKYEEPERAIRQ